MIQDDLQGLYDSGLRDEICQFARFFVKDNNSVRVVFDHYASGIQKRFVFFDGLNWFKS